MKIFKQNNIEFRADQLFVNEHKPQPAVRFLPEQYKKLSPYTEGDINKIGIMSDENGKVTKSHFTVKKCMPFLDALTAGYIIPTDSDIYVDFNGVDDPYLMMANGRNWLGLHTNDQFPHHNSVISKNKTTFFKYINPWIICTPKGYSCLFVNPLNHNNKYFNMMSGVVDTDNYNTEINLPFTWCGPVGSYIIPAGTPLIQVIPFKRENWTSDIDAHTEKSLKTRLLCNASLSAKIKDAYKSLFWAKKSFK
jgi:hypothetical protein